MIHEISFHLGETVVILASRNCPLKERLKVAWFEHLSRLTDMRESMPEPLRKMYFLFCNEIGSSGFTVDANGQIDEDAITRTLRSMRNKKVADLAKLVCEMHEISIEVMAKNKEG